MGAFAAGLRMDQTAAFDAQARLNQITAASWRQEDLTQTSKLTLAEAAAHERIGTTSVFGIAFLNNRDVIRTKVNAADPNLSDVALIARLYAIMRAPAPNILSGSFLIVVFDHTTGDVTAFRDHFGIYPFYCCQHAGYLTCGSDIRSVLHLSGMPLDQNPICIAVFVMDEEIDPTLTAFAGLRRLRPAHVLSCRNGVVQAQPYWRREAGDPISVTRTPPALLNHRKRATDAAVAGSKPVGSVLGGGLDSSSLTALASQSLKGKQGPLYALSFVYAFGKSYDETLYTEAANTAFGTQENLIPVITNDSLDDMKPLIEEQMDLFHAPGLLKSRKIYAVAKDLGLSALIDGHGGDEIISHGYGCLTELAAAHSWAQLFTEVRGAAKVHGTPVFWAVLSFHLQIWWIG